MKDEVRILVGDVLQTIKEISDASVQCAVTSPPYYGLRDYGMEDQIGLEETPEAYVEKLVQVFREVWRVLKDDGTLWLNLGDSYAGSGRGPEGGLSKGEKFRELEGKHKPYASDVIKPKDLIGIPWMVAFALRADGWYLRSDIIWAKPNPMPESVTDRCTKSHEYIFLLTKSAHYYYDADAIREPNADPERVNYIPGKRTNGINKDRNDNDFAERERKKFSEKQGGGGNGFRGHSGYMRKDGTPFGDGRNKRSVWTVTTKPYKEVHFATFPPKLIEPCILAGSRVGDVVIDPFSGSGTTGAVALKHHRRYIGFELNPAYVDLSYKRLTGVQYVLVEAKDE